MAQDFTGDIPLTEEEIAKLEASTFPMEIPWDKVTFTLEEDDGEESPPVSQ